MILTFYVKLACDCYLKQLIFCVENLKMGEMLMGEPEYGVFNVKLALN